MCVLNDRSVAQINCNRFEYIHLRQLKIHDEICPSNALSRGAPIAEYHITNAPISRCWNEKVFASTNVQPTKLISTANGTTMWTPPVVHTLSRQHSLAGWTGCAMCVLCVCVCARVHVIYGTIAYYWINKEIEFIRYHRALWADVRQQHAANGEKIEMRLDWLESCAN